MISTALAGFLIGILIQLPIQFRKIPSIKVSNKSTSVLDELIKLRANSQVSQNFTTPLNIPSWQHELAKLESLHKKCGVALLPVINHLIECERDEQNLRREFDERSSTAKTASVTLMFMPLMMWLIAVSIGIDVFGFLGSTFGVFSLTIGGVLTLSSRLVIERISKTALQKPRINHRKIIPSHIAALLVWITVFFVQSTFIGFSLAVIAGCLTHFYWESIPLQNEAQLAFAQHDKQHFQIQLLAGIIETGVSWSKALGHIEDAELDVLKGRIEMGVAPEKAFKDSNHWQKIGFVISNSMIRGSKVANDLRILADEYRKEAFSFRINRIEKFAGRLIIPVNLLQLPAFIVLGLIPLIAPLVVETFTSFHI